MELLQINTQQVIDAIQNGEIDPLIVKIWMKELSESMDAIKPIADQEALKEAEKYGVKTFDKLGYRFELSEFGTKYDYSATGHPQWNRLSFKAKEISEELKSVENTLKSLKASMTMVDEETGEVVTIYPPAKKSTSGVKLTKIK